MTLACVDGGLICGPILFAVIGGLLAWLKCRTTHCKDHSHDET